MATIKLPNSDQFDTMNGHLANIVGTATYAIGNRTYTENNYVTDSETVTASIDALDVAVGDVVESGSATPFANMPYVGTAPIVESGSNANGAYVKYADGTMLCWGAVTTSIACATALSSGGGYRSNAFTFSFPQTFHAAPTVVGTNLSPNDTMAVTVNVYSSGNPLTTGYAQWRTVSSAAAADRSASWLAIGRWKA